jgi:hypothetical protein
MSPLRLAAIATTLWAGIAAPAAAQGTMTIEITSIDGSEWMMTGDPIGGADCDAEAMVRLRVSGIPTAGVTHLDLWRGTDCNNTTSRNGSTTDNECTHINLTIMTLGSATQDLGPYALDTLFDCAGAEGSQTLWVLGANASPEMDDVTTNYGQVSLTIDRTAPTAPTDLSGGAGDSAIPVNWDAPAGETIERYVIFVDPGDCSSTELVAGGPAPTRSPDATASGSASSADLDGADLELALGDSAAVAVAAEDAAGNRGPLSNVDCIMRVETTGFWRGDGDSCSVARAGSTRGAAGLTIMLGVALAALLARRRR